MKSRLVVLPVERYQELEEKIELLFQLWGKNNFSSKKILLKPNLLSAHKPEECVTTHPALVKSVARYLLKNKCKILIGDSPGGYADIDKVYTVTGMKDVASELGIEMVKFEKPKLINNIPLAEELFKVDVIISLPKFKTHSLTLLTGAVKNCYGYLPGLYKSDCHRRFPKPEEFSKLLLEIYQIKKPHFSIVDAIFAMEGDGPTNGNPRKVGLIIGGQDGVSIDIFLALIMGIDPYLVPTNRLARELNIGVTDISQMEIIGIDDFKKYVIDDFKLPRTSLLAKIPRPLIGILGKIIRFYPEVDRGKCNACGICVKSCPVSAIEIIASSARINHKKCIMCLCCHELCPQRAIEVKRNYLARKVGI